MNIDRRTLLVASVSALLAGCTGDDGGVDATPTATESPDSRGTSGESSTPTATSPGSTTTSTGSTTTSTGSTMGEAATATQAATATETPTATGDDLDLQEANVTAVEVERDGVTVGFDVTLFHDDDGEDGYANWWQIETIGGEKLGRRDLLHAHGTRRFTRSDSFEMPADVTCVVVRGHDQTHEYGGQAMLVNLASGATVTRRQGAEPQSFDESDCP